MVKASHWGVVSQETSPIRSASEPGWELSETRPSSTKESPSGHPPTGTVLGEVVTEEVTVVGGEVVTVVEATLGAQAASSVETRPAVRKLVLMTV
jgi:hypothetical protein